MVQIFDSSIDLHFPHAHDNGKHLNDIMNSYEGNNKLKLTLNNDS